MELQSNTVLLRRLPVGRSSKADRSAGAWLAAELENALEGAPDVQTILADTCGAEHTALSEMAGQGTMVFAAPGKPSRMDRLCQLLFGVKSGVLQAKAFAFDAEAARAYLSEKRSGAIAPELLRTARDCGARIEICPADAEEELSFGGLLRYAIQYYRQQLLFCLSSFVTFMLELGIFAVMTDLFLQLGLRDYSFALATLVGRVISAVANYLLNQKLVFCRKEQAPGGVLKFAALNAAQMGLSAALVTAAVVLGHMHDVLAKVIVDTVLFFLSFYAQKFWIFR